MSSSSKYSAKLASSSSDTLEKWDATDDPQGPLLPTEPWPRHKRRTSYYTWMLMAISYFCVAGVTFVATRRFITRPCDTYEHIPEFMHGIDRSFHFERGNSASTKSSDPNNPNAGELSWNNFTISTERGGDEIEEWWLDLGTYTTPVLVPEEYAAELGFDQDKHECVRPDGPGWKPGEVPYSGYPASIEVMHKLHCVDLLRQASFYNHEYYSRLHAAPWHPGRETLMRHVAHCVDILRQKIICDAEIVLVPFEKGAGQHPRNDWTLPRKCRNFESVRSWLVDHQWVAGDPNFYLNDHHSFVDRQTFTKVPRHSMEELWRGY